MTVSTVQATITKTIKDGPFSNSTLFKAFLRFLKTGNTFQAFSCFTHSKRLETLKIENKMQVDCLHFQQVGKRARGGAIVLMTRNW